MVDVSMSWLGDSMRPRIVPGAILFVDCGPELRGPSSFEEGAVYFVKYEKGMTVKRVWLTGNTLNCHSDNHTHPPLVLPIDKRRGVLANLIGKVSHVANSME